MTPPAAVQRPSAGPTSPQLRSRRTPILLTVLAVAGVLLVSQLLASPHYVGRLTFHNPTDYQLAAEVSDGTKGWLPLGSLDGRASTSVGEVYDLGDVWNVRLFTQGRPAGHLRLTRAQLERSHWNVQIPRQIGDQLQAAGVVRQP